MKYDFDTVRSRYNTFSMKYDGMGKRLKPGFIPLFVADMDLKCPPAIIEAMHKVADHEIYGYSGSFADDRYNQSIIRWFGDKYGFKIEPDWILPSAGTCSAINAAIREFSNVGDGVIICRPVYGHFTGMIEGDCHRKAVDCHLIKDENGNFHMDFDKLDKLCSEPNNRIFLLCSPHNPVGRVWTREELEKVVAITKKHNVMLLVDEIHCDIRREGIDFIPVGTVTNDYSNICIFGGLGKTFNTAGLMCSNAIVPDEFLRARIRNELSGGLSPFAIAACITAYGGECDEWVDEMNKYIDGNIDYAIDFCKKNMPWVEVGRPEGTYCLWLDFGKSGLSGEEIHRRIYEDASVILQDGTVHDPEFGATCQRMCTPVARSVLVEAMERIAKVFEDIK